MIEEVLKWDKSKGYQREGVVFAKPPSARQRCGNTLRGANKEKLFARHL
jgi:hypothetical protein